MRNCFGVFHLKEGKYFRNGPLIEVNYINILPYVDIDPTIEVFFKRSYSWGIMDKWNKPLSLCSLYICRMVDHPDLNRERGYK